MREIVLLAKTERFSDLARTVAQAIFGPALQTFQGVVGDPLPKPLAEARPRYLLSFLSPWIVPADLLDRSGTSLNFHPGSTDYPGIGCYNFALYEGAEEFGAVCHHMLPKVDTGVIVDERRFPVLAGDSVETLKLRTMVTMLAMFHDVASLIAAGRELPTAERQWSRRPFTRKEMNALREVTPDMRPEEVERRVRAMTYPGYPGPSVEIGGRRFFCEVPQRPPLA